MATKKEIEINLKSTLDGKGVQEAKQQIDSLNKSTEQLDKGSQQATRSVKRMGQGMLQVAYFMDDVQYGIKGILNNIPGLVIGFGGGAGLAGAISLATLAGAKLYEWLSDSADKTDDLSKKMKDRSKEIADFLRDAERERITFIQNANKENLSNTVNQEYKRYVEGITQEYKKQTDEIEYQLNLRKREIANRENIKTADLDLQKAQTELEFEQGRITKRERDRLNLEIDQEFDRRREHAQLLIAENELKSLDERRSEAEYSLGQIGLELSNFFNLIRSLPSLEEMSSSLREESNTRRRMQVLDNKMNNLEIDPAQYKKEYDILFKDNARASSRIQAAQLSLQKAGVEFAPTYGEGKTDLDRTKEYQVALDSLTKKQLELEKSAADLSDTLKSLDKEIPLKETDIQNIEEIRGIREKIRYVRVNTFDEREDKQGRANQLKEQIEKAQERELNIKNNLESNINQLAADAGKSANDQQKAMVRAASEAIRNQVKIALSDGIIDSREYDQIGVAFRDALRQQGIQNQTILRGLTGNMREALSLLNQQSSQLRAQQDQIQQMKRDLAQAQNNVKGLRRR